jgi:hypothetical protein
MAILERRILRILAGRWDDVLALEKRWDALEARLGGFAPKRRYRTLSGGLWLSMWVWEREWESLAAAEAAYARMGADPECSALVALNRELSEDGPIEFYRALP